MVGRWPAHNVRAWATCYFSPFASFTRSPTLRGARLRGRLVDVIRRCQAVGLTAPGERDLILQRTNEGRARAMAEGKFFGRKPKLTKHQAREALKRAAAGETLREIALSYNVDHSTISRLEGRHVVDS